MDIDSEIQIENGRPVKVDLSWSIDGEIKKLHFEYDISYKISDETNQLFVEIYEINKIQVFDFFANLESEIDIPELPGYQFRGINKNTKSVTGISLLYFPIDKNHGNEWRDIEQYELINGESPLGKRIGIYR